MKFDKLGLVFTPKNICDWWYSHAMAPTAIYLPEKQVIRVYMGCWDSNGISRIGYIDVNPSNPLDIINKSDKPVLDIGKNGCFDENGVFPGHASIIKGKVHLHYTGFQLGQKIRHYNFGGLAISSDGQNFERISQAPVLDRKDEGLLVRAGASVILDDGTYRAVYSAGSEWTSAGGKERPTYDVFYQELSSPSTFFESGRKILRHRSATEHGLGRPQIICKQKKLYTFFTSRSLNMKYFFGVASSSDNGNNWERIDSLEGLKHSHNGFDSEMIYFPSVVSTETEDYLFYSGNNFGGGGLGVAKITEW